MATGDLHGNLGRLISQMRSVGYRGAIDVDGLKKGHPLAILPLLHHALLGYSRHVARHLVASGYEFHGNLRFVESVLKVAQCEFGYRSPLTVGQIFSKGFPERKMLLVYDIVQCCKRLHSEFLRAARQPGARKLGRRDVVSHLFSFLNFLFESLQDGNKYEIVYQKRCNRCPDPDDKFRSVVTIKQPAQDHTSPRKEQADPKPELHKTPAKKRFVEILMRTPPQAVKATSDSSNSSSSEIPQTPRKDSSLPRALDPNIFCQKLPTVSPRIHEFMPSPRKTECVPLPATLTPRELEATKGSPRIVYVNPLPVHASPRSESSSKMLDAITGLLHDEIKGKIHEISEKIEPRFSSFERCLKQASKQMEAQLCGLENRIILVEEMFRLKGARDSENNSPRRKASLERISSPRRHEFPFSGHAVRDISNVFPGSQQSPRFDYKSHPTARRELSTPELIAAVKARCNRTNELLERRLI